MKRIHRRILMRKLLRSGSSKAGPGGEYNPQLQADLREWSKLKGTLENNRPVFREGFAERTTARLTGMLEKETLKEYYASLSSYLPKILYSSLVAFIIAIAVLFALNGEVNTDTLVGTEKIDDSNFISYLLLENNR